MTPTSSTTKDSPTLTAMLDDRVQPLHGPLESNSCSTEEHEKRTAAKQPQRHESSRSLLRSIVIVIVTTLSMVVNMGNTTMITIALPVIGKEMIADPSLLQWVVSAYPLSSGCLLLVCGRLADLYGRKKAYLVGTLILAAFTLGCGLANNITTLIILRGIQGVGAAATIPASLGILAHVFPPSKARSLAFATFSAGAPIGGILGLVLGGLLTETTAQTWRSTLFMFAAFNVVCLVGGALCIDKDISHPKDDRKVDWLGAFLVTAAFVMIMFVLGEGESAPKKWATGYIIALLVISAFLIGLFIYWQWFLEKVQNQHQERHEGVSHLNESGEPTPRESLIDRWHDELPPPLMKLSLWGRAKGRFTAVMVIAFFTWSAFIAWTFWVQLYYQDYTNLKPLGVVVRLLPMFVAGLACNAFMGLMASHIPMVMITTMGTLGTATACLLFAIINPRATYWAFGFPATILSVAGVDLVYTSGTLYIAKISEPHEQSLAGALFQTMTQIGTSAGVTISTVVFNRVTSTLKEGEDNIQSYKAAQWTTCAFAAFAALISLLVFRGVGVPGHTQSQSSLQDNERGTSVEEKKIEESTIQKSDAI